MADLAGHGSIFCCKLEQLYDIYIGHFYDSHATNKKGAVLLIFEQATSSGAP